MRIPPTFPICLNTACPRIATCLRFTAGKDLLPTQQCALTVLPHVLTPDGECPMYRDNAPITVAYGFSILFSNVKKKDVIPIREKIIEYVGSQSGYYRYNNGARQLTPLQQERILAIFREFGYQENLSFDNYSETHDFSD